MAAVEFPCRFAVSGSGDVAVVPAAYQWADNSTEAYAPPAFAPAGHSSLGVNAGALYFGDFNGDGAFRPPNFTYRTPGFSGYAIGDLDQDGKPDLVISETLPKGIESAPSIASSRLRFFRGNGDGTMGQPFDYALETYAAADSVLDLNGDGLPDVALRYGADVVVLLNAGHGTSGPP